MAVLSGSAEARHDPELGKDGNAFLSRGVSPARPFSRKFGQKLGRVLGVRETGCRETGPGKTVFSLSPHNVRAGECLSERAGDGAEGRSSPAKLVSRGEL